MHADDLFTAPQVAKICSTDLKTIHNWVNRGEINYFRTPGRHLRFRREDILEFLVKFGYPVPDSFAPKRPIVVAVDGSSDRLISIKRALNDHAEVNTFQDHLDALIAIGQNYPALVILNGDAGPEIIRMVARLKSVQKDLPVLTYGSSGDLAEQAKRAGAKEHIKGLSADDIRNKAVAVLSKNH